MALFAVWGVLALSQLIWALLPAGEVPCRRTAVVINPVSAARRLRQQCHPVDIERLQCLAPVRRGRCAGCRRSAGSRRSNRCAARDGIEKGARETRLALKLRGVVASSEDGLGYAVIEHKSKQDIYAVEDKLPLSGQVVLAKVMTRQVVLDNGGTYELLELFEDSALDTQLSAAAARGSAVRLAAPGRLWP